MESHLTRVTPVRPVAPYIGGKRNLAGRQVKLINEIPHQVYAEPFVGMGGVFLRRDRRPRTEIINDGAGDVANLYRILREHYPQFMDVLKFQITSRADFDRLKATDPSTLTDLQRAARFLYLQRTAFGGKVTGRNFGMERGGRGGRFDITVLAPLLADVHQRMAGVIIENLDWRAFIAQYDRPGTLFYLDPPYWGCEDDYGEGLFGPDQFALMAVDLARLQGRFVLSINDRPQIREIFAAFTLIEAETTYSVSDVGATRAKELIITNS